MSWTGLLILLVAVVAMFFLRKAGQASASDARALLSEGAIVVDVRTAGEFAGGHLRGAINIPLDEIATALPKRFPDRKKPILLHCQSGMRSGAARKQLQALGYTRALNLGSYARAKEMLSAK